MIFKIGQKVYITSHHHGLIGEKFKIISKKEKDSLVNQKYTIYEVSDENNHTAWINELYILKDKPRRKHYARKNINYNIEDDEGEASGVVTESQSTFVDGTKGGKNGKQTNIEQQTDRIGTTDKSI